MQSPSTTYNAHRQVAGHLESAPSGGLAKVSAAQDGGLIKLSDAARLLGCHVETLRLRVRRGELSVQRGAHGTYYLTSAALAEIVPPRRSRTRVFKRDPLEWSWELLEQQLPLKGRWAQRAPPARIAREGGLKIAQVR